MLLVPDLSQSSSHVWWDNGIWNLVRLHGMHLLSEQSCVVFTADLPVAEARQVSAASNSCMAGASPDLMQCWVECHRHCRSVYCHFLPCAL